mgnify:CR=1 FL=1
MKLQKIIRLFYKNIKEMSVQFSCFCIISEAKEHKRKVSTRTS